jgi:hypothetical protein
LFVTTNWRLRRLSRTGEDGEKLLRILESLGGKPETRTVVAFRHSLESFVEETRTLELAINLERKLES